MKKLLFIFLLLSHSQIFAQKQYPGVFDKNSRLLNLIQTYQRTGEKIYNSSEAGSPFLATPYEQLLARTIKSNFQFYSALGDPNEYFEELKKIFRDFMKLRPLEADSSLSEQINYIEKQTALLESLHVIINDMKQSGFFDYLNKHNWKIDYQELELSEQLEKTMKQSSGHSPLVPLKRYLEKYQTLNLTLTSILYMVVFPNTDLIQLEFMPFMGVTLGIALTVFTLYKAMLKALSHMAPKQIGLSAEAIATSKKLLEIKISELKSSLLQVNASIRSAYSCKGSTK